MLFSLYNLTVAVAALILYLYGLFPLQQSHSTNSLEPPTFMNDVEFNTSKLYEPKVDRLVLVVIDALRMDFVENMPFLASSIHTKGCMYKTRVESPTVTLPRIKSLMTGTIPQFLDIVRNLASGQALQDSFLHKAQQSGKKIVFYGDDTWLKLFPNVFIRHEGVSSFFVSDFTEVDDNVTRNVVKELENTDWDIMVLHYLGLDHIGHVYGPFSSYVAPKLKEMDSVVRRIHEALHPGKRTLVIVTGDHGMKDSGGHGGSTVSEVYVPLIPIGIACNNDLIAQIDVPSTLATLMGLPLSAGSVGRLITQMLSSLPPESVLYALRYNTLALQSQGVDCDAFDEATNSHLRYVKYKNELDAFDAREYYEVCSKQISDQLVRSSVQQNIFYSVVGNVVLVKCFLASVYHYMYSYEELMKSDVVLTSGILVSQFVAPQDEFIAIISIIVLCGYCMYYKMKILKRIHKIKLSYVLYACAAHPILLLSSSFIEEEHQIWYFTWGTFLLLNWFDNRHKWSSVIWLLMFCSLRVLRTINQTGDKWAHLPDLKQWLLLPENNFYLHCFFILGLVLIWLYFLLKSKHQFLLLECMTLGSIWLHHMLKTENIEIVKIIWFIIAINFVMKYLFDKKNTLENVIQTWVMYTALLTQPYNVIFLPAYLFGSHIIIKNIRRSDIAITAHIWLGKVLFFCQGHSNSFASVNIASGYVGLTDYSPLLVIPQVLCYTYTFPLLGNLILLQSYSWSSVWKRNATIQLLVVSTMAVSVLCQRHHLFVWSVFTPKLLIEATNTLVLLTQLLLLYVTVNLRKLVRVATSLMSQ